MRKFKLIGFLLLAVLVLPSPNLQAETPPSPQDLIGQMSRKFDSLKDYKCQMHMTEMKKGRSAFESNNYYFKKPKLIRIEMTAGDNNGAKVVLNKQGKVRAKAGGVLGMFTVTMEPNDKRLQDSSGNTFVSSDLGSTIKDLKQALSGGTATLTVVEHNRKIYQLQIERPGKRDVIMINADSLLPASWTSFRNGAFHSRTEWRNLVVDSGVNDSLFEM